ncbi:MAG: YraN family protein [Ruminococcus sp.]|nr:YraN family protein [Ruminococcus sp.]
MKKFSTQNIGEIGEEYTVKFLEKKKYNILERNYRKRYGEIDIIAENKNYIVFVEVKTRHKDSMASAADAVNRQKQIRIIKTASLYLAENETEKFCRFDVCEVYINSDNLKLVDINYIEAAFE